MSPARARRLIEKATTRSAGTWCSSGIAQCRVGSLSSGTNRTSWVELVVDTHLSGVARHHDVSG
ncbi:hypothetical protein OH76DRAFT_1490928 [Lentinus brumalis]|uniref:Uncharacterized protein n=1 Tax=Lentinus brumalis TaxID=2498619 RepID=A0A371CHB5_9APHY|nr:hypothetical protein OH76DRAFT_1490928 [Polyporus brumalis]